MKNNGKNRVLVRAGQSVLYNITKQQSGRHWVLIHFTFHSFFKHKYPSRGKKINAIHVHIMLIECTVCTCTHIHVHSTYMYVAHYFRVFMDTVAMDTYSCHGYGCYEYSFHGNRRGYM